MVSRAYFVVPSISRDDRLSPPGVHSSLSVDLPALASPFHEDLQIDAVKKSDWLPFHAARNEMKSTSTCLRFRNPSARARAGRLSPSCAGLGDCGALARASFYSLSRRVRYCRIGVSRIEARNLKRSKRESRRRQATGSSGKHLRHELRRARRGIRTLQTGARFVRPWQV
jgi:hypothetical protein